MAVKLIATDIDGTLLDSRHQISEKNLAALDDAAGRGIEIVLVTGRRFDFARQIADQLRCDWHLISSNGAVIKSPDGKTHQRDLLDAKLARRVLDSTREFRSGAAVVFDRERARQVVVEKIDLDDPFRGSYFRRNMEFVTAVDPLTNCLNGDDPIQVGYVGRCSHMREIKNILENLPFAGEYTLAITEYEFSDL